MSQGRRIKISGYRLDKGGRLVRCSWHTGKLEKPRPERANVLALARAHEIDTAPHAVACARLGSRANSRTSGQADDPKRPPN